MIKQLILKSTNPFIDEIRKSIKSIDVEENLDLILHRPLGLIFSKFAVKKGISAMQVSYLSLTSGILAGICLYFQTNIQVIILAAIFLTLSAVFDSADGQVARMTKTSSRAGMIIDGIIDSAVFLAAYLGASFYFYFNTSYGIWIFILAIACGYTHSIKAKIFDYFKNEVLFLYSNFDNFRNPTILENKEVLNKSQSFFSKIGSLLHYDYVRQQSYFIDFRNEKKKQFEKLRGNSNFKKEYKKHFFFLMTLWALTGGSNIHRILLVTFCLFGRFDLYLWFTLIFMTVQFYIVLSLQKKADQKFLAKMC